MFVLRASIKNYIAESLVQIRRMADRLSSTSDEVAEVCRTYLCGEIRQLEQVSVLAGLGPITDITTPILKSLGCERSMHVYRQVVTR